MIEVYFSNKSSTKTSKVFNRPPQNTGMMTSSIRKSVAVQKDILLKQQIFLEVKGLQFKKLLINPNIFNVDLTMVYEHEKRLNVDLLDEVSLKNQKKRQTYKQIIQFSNFSKQSQNQQINKPKPMDSVNQLINLTGINQNKAKQLLQKYGSIQKAYEQHTNRKNVIQQFMTKEKTNQQQALFYLESSNFNIIQASRLIKQMKG